MHLEILLEEESMQIVVDTLLTRMKVNEAHHTWETHPHKGKKDLLRKLQQKLRAYRQFLHHYYDDFCILILIDQDEDDCYELKDQIQEVANDIGFTSGENVIVRIVIPELESCFLGDTQALETTFSKLTRKNIGRKAIYREPDGRPYPADDLDRELKAVGYSGYLKIAHSRELSQCMTLNFEENRSKSFGVFLSKVIDLLNLDY